jgi:hypothetical protein
MKGENIMRARLKLTMLVMTLGLVWATGAIAQQVNPPPSQFAITGFIEEATLNPRVGTSIPPNPRLYGGTLTVNGVKMIVPNNSIIQMPATSMTWADLFNPANSASVGYNPPRPNHGAGISGLALADNLVNPLAGTRAGAGLGSIPGSGPYPSYEVSVNGNVLPDGRYVVGLIVPVEQQVLNGTGGLISYIDYATGRFRVGGIPGSATTGTLCEINDPVGRFGLPHSPDPRFTCDYNNPTITTATGYPVGIPNVAPPLSDPDRPLINRPLNPIAADPNHDPFLAVGSPLRTFTMNIPGPGSACNPTKQVPLMVGDWIDFAGTVFKINPLGPNTAANTFVSIYSVTAHLSIKTAPGTTPAYVRVEEMLFGVGDGAGGPTVSAGIPGTPITQETASHVTMVSFTTDSDPNAVITKPPDPRNPILPTGSIFGIYVDPVTGVETEEPFPNGNATNRDFEIDDAVRGRLLWRTAKNPKPPIIGTLGNAVGPGNFYREYILKISTGQVQLGNQAQLQPNGQPLPGLIAGQYRFPIFEYIFGEGTVFGQPVPPNNYNDFGFLFIGSGPLNGPGTGPPLIGKLNPWPGP